MTPPRRTSECAPDEAQLRSLSKSNAHRVGPMQRHLLTAVILIAALAFYGAGMGEGASMLFVAGCACELWFWVRMRAHHRHA